MIVTIVPVRISSTVDNTTGSIQVDKSAALSEMSKVGTKLWLLSLFAHGVDPELSRTGIQVDGDLVSRCSQGNVDAVEKTVLLRLEKDFVLSLGDTLYDRAAGADLEREDDHAIWGVVANGDVGNVDGGCDCGGRNGEEKSG